MTHPILTWDLTQSFVGRDSFIYGTKTIHICQPSSHRHVKQSEGCKWHDSFTCVTWLIRMWDMTHSYVGHKSFIFVITCSYTSTKQALAGQEGTEGGTWHVSFICWQYSFDIWDEIFPVWDYTHSYVKPEPLAGQEKLEGGTWHDSFIGWQYSLIFEMTHSSVRYDGFKLDVPFTGRPSRNRRGCVTWLFHRLTIHVDIWDDSFLREIWRILFLQVRFTGRPRRNWRGWVTWLFHKLTILVDIRDDSFLREIWRILTWNTIRSYVG